MRILHLHDAPHVPGGATAYLRRLVPWLAARGHENAVFSLDRPADGLPAPSACYRYPWPPGAIRRRLDFTVSHPPLARALEELARDWRPDVVHVQNLAAFRTTLFPALGRLEAPVVMTVHDFSLADPNPAGHAREGLKGALLALLDREHCLRARRAALRAVDLFLCPTRALQAGLRLPDRRSRVLRLPVEPAEAPPLPPVPPLRLFFAGTLFRSKGVDVLLEALARARGPAAGALLEIAGQGDQEGELRERAARLGLSERVRFLGQLGPEAMDAAYGRAALQVLPSRVPENSPLTVLEAGARGRPSVATGLGGVPELLEPPAKGWTVPPEDPGALARVLEEAAGNPAELARRGAAMRAWVRAEFDPERHWRAVEAAYQELVAVRGGAGSR